MSVEYTWRLVGVKTQTTCTLWNLFVFIHKYRTSSIRCRSYYFFAAWFCMTTNRGWHLFPWKACTHQWHVPALQWPLLDAVSSTHSLLSAMETIELYNTNTPSTSQVTVIRNYLQSCLCATYTSHGYYSRAAFICSELPIVRLLFEGSVYLKKYGMP